MSKKQIIGTIVFLSLGLDCFLVYAFINKIDIISALTSGQAFFIYLAIIIVSLIVGTELWKRKVLGDDDDED